MKISDIIDAIKAFFLDFLGYFLPGIYALIILTYIVSPSYHFNTAAIGFISADYEYVAVLLFAYILGYVIYSLELSELVSKAEFLGIKTSSQIESEIKASFEFDLCKKVLTELWIDKNGASILSANSLTSMNTRNLRSIVMSYIPESDIKIYTFMFRSDLCKHVASFSILFGSIGLMVSLIHYLFGWSVFLNIGKEYTCAYSLLLVGSYFLLKTRSRFLSIAYKIPFSMFLSKFYKFA
jgi:hypothetical protein